MRQPLCSQLYFSPVPQFLLLPLQPCQVIAAMMADAAPHNCSVTREPDMIIRLTSNMIKDRKKHGETSFIRINYD